ILVDTGIGDKYNEKFEGIYNIDQSQYNLKGSLAKYGFSPADITDVIITHLHFDHVGGSTYLEGDQAKPTFPNAMYFIQKAQWDWAHNPSERDQASFFKENFDPLQKAGQLKLLDGECQLYPGIQIIVVEGHTPGQQLVKVSDGKTTLVYCGDLIPLASQVHIPYMMSYDLFPTKTLEEKKKFLAQACEERWILFFEHDPLVEAARIKQVTKGYAIDEKITLD
ncbi:MAG: MBL fold metallo-hydrolase, partial [candidate division KSB1 bacterium]|nr:MBL fold metallo-hydrolase [candidate division KSB1 bacterium]